MKKNLLKKYCDELSKLNLEFVDVKEYNEMWKGKLNKDGEVIFANHSLSKFTQWNMVESYAKATQKMVEMAEKIKFLTRGN